MRATLQDWWYSTPGGELPAAIAASYNELVTRFIESIVPEIGSGIPYWSLLAKAQDSPSMLTFPVNGSSVLFDLHFHHRPRETGEKHGHLVVETKASYDSSYIDRGFRDFLGRVRQVVDQVSTNAGEDWLFAFVSPLLPTRMPSPRIAHSSEELCSLYESVGEPSLNLDEQDMLRGRVFAVVVASELSGVWGIH